ncbi:MAG: YceI family protein, partial [Bacteroidota bacterium]
SIGTKCMPIMLYRQTMCKQLNFTDMTTTTQEKTIWTIDPSHSEVQFKVRHLVISTVTGNFRKFEGAFETSQEDFGDAAINFKAQIDSLDTNNGQRDSHLKSADFFDAENFPELTFKSKSFQKKGSEQYSLVGDLTIRGVSKEVILDVEYGGTMTDPYGNVKAGFEVKTVINRKEFGLNWGAVTEAGGVVVGDEVKILANVQFVKSK